MLQCKELDAGDLAESEDKSNEPRREGIHSALFFSSRKASRVPLNRRVMSSASYVMRDAGVNVCNACVLACPNYIASPKRTRGSEISTSDQQIRI